METEIEILPTFTDFLDARSEGDNALLAFRTADGGLLGIEIAPGALMPTVMGLITAGKALAKQATPFDAQSFRAESFETLTQPDGTKGLAIGFGGQLRIVLKIPQDKLAALRGAIARLEELPDSPKKRH